MSSLRAVSLPPSIPSYREGDRFGDYRIVRKIGAGGMASVWLARHIPLNRLVALKILRSELAADPRSVRRFIQEARSAARLENPAIVHIYEVGTLGKRLRLTDADGLGADGLGGCGFRGDGLRGGGLGGDGLGGDGMAPFMTEKVKDCGDQEKIPVLQKGVEDKFENEFEKSGKKQIGFFRALWSFFGGRKPPIHFIAEEYVPGMNLGLYVRRHGPLSTFQTLTVVRQVAVALQCAADSGIVHRDIKPENILLSESGGVKVADFGLASCQTADDGIDLSLTRVGVTLGTPLYMSPEQAEGKRLDSRSDLYSLGVAAFWMLSGRVPFTGETPMAVLLQHINLPPPDLRTLRSDIPSEMAEMVTRLMAKKPSDRFDSPKDLQETVQKIQRRLAKPSRGGRSDGWQNGDDGLILDSFPPSDGGGSDSERGTGVSRSDGSEMNSTMISAAVDSEFPTGKSFFGHPDEELFFTREMNALETTRRLQTTLTTWKSLEASDDSARFRGYRLGGIIASAVLAALLAGTGWAYYQTRIHPPVDLSSTAIQRLDSVEEQWVFATQLGTSEAWQSVIDLFPDDPYWIGKARRQLARALMLEGQTDRARLLFDEFISGSGADRSNLFFGMAGRAWVLATEGNFDEATALLSELRSGSERSYDRLTEEIISKTGGMIREGNGRRS